MLDSPSQYALDSNKIDFVRRADLALTEAEVLLVLQ
jgi:hypothetical protein